MYRIGDVYFDTREEAEDWIKAGNIGGTYSIVPMVYCPDHLGWFDEVYDRRADEFVCAKCWPERQKRYADEYREAQQQQQQIERERALLAEWNAGQPIKPYLGPYVRSER